MCAAIPLPTPLTTTPLFLQTPLCIIHSTLTCLQQDTILSSLRQRTQLNI